jgi:hypothetical protein
MKSVPLQMARAIRVTGALGAAAGVLLFLVALFAKVNFGRIFGVVIDGWRPNWAPRQLLWTKIGRWTG